MFNIAAQHESEVPPADDSTRANSLQAPEASKQCLFAFYYYALTLKFPLDGTFALKVNLSFLSVLNTYANINCFVLRTWILKYVDK